MKNLKAIIKMYSSPKIIRISILVLSISFSLNFYGQVNDFVLNPSFQDHMVIQREKPVKIWGTGIPGTRIEVRIGDQKSVIKVKRSGEWATVFSALTEKGPYSIEVQSKDNRVIINDILVGDVWIASGQSNMEWPVKATNFQETDSAWLNSGQIRMLKIKAEMDYEPREEYESDGWKILNKENAEEFSAVAYHFGKSLNIETGIPIGLISANLGATSIETWMSNESLSRFPQFQLESNGSFEELNNAFRDGTTPWSKDVYYSGKGMDEKWYQIPYENSSDWHTIEVAGNTWETIEELKNFDGAVWFRKKFDIPENFTGDSLSLQLLQIDDYDITWVNGKKIGETFGKHNHRNYNVALSDLKSKDNLIVIRVFDSGGIGGFTTSAFWGNNILWGEWQYRKGKEILATEFIGPNLPNATPFSSPSVLYNGTIAPLTKMNVKGFIWYQGESNEARAQEYQQLFPELIRNWRSKFDQGNLPFLFVQLANYRQETMEPQDSQWAELREAQSMALKEPNTGMAVAIDLGEADDIHPKNKEAVGKRLGKLALKIAYNSDITAESPQLEKMEIAQGRAIISLDQKEGIINKNKYGYIRGFQISGEDRKFYFAKAKLEAGKIHVWSGEVKHPVAVRYAWSDNPGDLDIYNHQGLPLTPFRTDNWKLSTEGNVFQDGPRF